MLGAAIPLIPTGVQREHLVAWPVLTLSHPPIFDHRDFLSQCKSDSRAGCHCCNCGLLHD